MQEWVRKEEYEARKEEPAFAEYSFEEAGKPGDCSHPNEAMAAGGIWKCPDCGAGRWVPSTMEP